MKTLIKVAASGIIVAFTLAISATAFAAAELEATKTPDRLVVAPGGTITYTIVVRNTGDADATGVSVTDLFDDDMNFVSSNPTPSSQTGNEVTWDLGTVAEGTSESIVVNVSLDSSFSGSTVDLTGNKVLINLAEAEGDGDLHAVGQSVIEGSVTGGVPIPPPSGGLPTTGIPIAAAIVLGAGALLGIKWALAANR